MTCSGNALELMFVDDFDEFIDEVFPMMEENYKESGVLGAECQFAPDLDGFANAFEAGALHILIARNADKEVVGYTINCITYHPMHRLHKGACNVVLYVRPDYRKGSLGLRLMREAEHALRAAGVAFWEISTCGRDEVKPMDKLLERIGCRSVGKTYLKTLEV